MKKYFVASDIHGFYTEFIDALKSHGFDAHNPNHILIILGDIFDRGPEDLQVFHFLRDFPKDRKILIRGNHEYLLRDLLKKELPDQYDYSNGTVDTVMQFNNLHNLFGIYGEPMGKFAPKVRASGVLDWIFSDCWVDYYELGKFIFVHSYIPMNYNSDPWQESLDFYYRGPYYVRLDNYKNFTFKEGWREASPAEWQDASWGCPYMYIMAGKAVPDRTVVCGHWKTSDFFFDLEPDADHVDGDPIFYSNEIIDIDGCTALSGKVNILVLDDQYNIIK